MACAGLAPWGELRAATVSLCESASLAGKGGKEMYGPDGRLVTLAIGDTPPAPDCEVVEVPVSTTSVRWFTLTEIPPAASPLPRLGLQGFFDAHEARVSEVIFDEMEVRNERGFVPFNVDLQPYFEARAFGVEERAGVDGRVLSCAAGERVAGITLRSALAWEQLAGVELEIAASGSGEFEVAVADRAREEGEKPLGLGTLVLRADTPASRFALPANPEPWSSLVIFCPATAATLNLDALKLVPGQHLPSSLPRATWLWSPDIWRSAPETAWRIAERENLHKVYVTVPVTSEGEIADAARLAAFIADARARGISVWAVAGDRSDVLPENLAIVVTRAEAYSRFNVAHPDAPLAGLQLDVEPYLLPGITLAPDYWRERYVATVAAVHAQLAGRLPLDLVMPVWWGLHPAWGSRLLDALVLPDLSLTVMNYRTNADALRVGAMPFLAWGQEHGKRVSMALETGRAGVNSDNGRDETRIDYIAAENAGELWMLQVGGMSLLVLLDEAHAGLPGRPYARASERTISTGTISFADAPANLQAIAATLEAEWSAWDAFAGLAIHGLDQIDAQGR